MSGSKLEDSAFANLNAPASRGKMMLAQYEYDSFGNLIDKSGLMANPSGPPPPPQWFHF
jgi:hypothetical protein